LLAPAAGLLVLAARVVTGRIWAEIAQALPGGLPGGTLVGEEGTSAFGALLLPPAAPRRPMKRPWIAPVLPWL
jgi:hypothetical protein